MNVFTNTPNGRRPGFPGAPLAGTPARAAFPSLPPMLAQILFGGGISPSNPLPAATPPFLPGSTPTVGTPPFFPGNPGRPGVIPQTNAGRGARVMPGMPNAASQTGQELQAKAPAGFFGKADAFLQNPFVMNLLAQTGFSTVPTGGPLAAIGRAGLMTAQQKREQALSDLNRELIESQIGLNRSKAGQQPEQFVTLTTDEKKALGIPEGSFAQQSTTTGQIKVDDAPRNGPLVTVDTGAATQTLANTIAEGRAKSYIERRPEAETALATLGAINNARTQVDAGIKSGQFATVQLGLAKTLNALGLANDESVANTETFIAQTGGLVAQLIKQFGAGTGLSDADRDFAERMAGGKITLDEQSIRRILGMAETAQRNIVKNLNADRASLIRVDPALEPLLGPALELPGSGPASSASDDVRNMSNNELRRRLGLPAAQ